MKKGDRENGLVVPFISEIEGLVLSIMKKNRKRNEKGDLLELGFFHKIPSHDSSYEKKVVFLNLVELIYKYSLRPKITTSHLRINQNLLSLIKFTTKSISIYNT